MANYFVKTGGSDGADGLTDGTAWATISKVNGFTFADNDVISFNRGNSWAEMLTVPKTNLTFNAYGDGAKPIITGSGARANAILCAHDGCTFENIVCTAGTAAGFFLNDADNATLNLMESHANATNGYTLNGHGLDVSASKAYNNTQVGFLQTGTYQTPTFVSCESYDNTQDGYRITGSTDIVMTLCSATGNGTGGTVARGLVLLGVVGGSIGRFIADGNDVHGILLSNNGGTATSGLDFDQPILRNNGAGSGAGSGMSVEGAATNIDVRRPVCHNNDEAGITLRGTGVDNKISYGIFHTEARGVWITANCLQFQEIYNSTFYECTTAGVALTGSATQAAVVLRNNIFKDNAIGILADAEGISVIHDFNYDLFHGHTTTAIRWDEDDYADGAIDGFFGAESMEEFGIGNSDPLLMNPPLGFWLSAGSPAIGAGTSLLGYGPDQAGAAPRNPPSLGACEYKGWNWNPSGGV